VTGTNRKTTTNNLIKSLLKKKGITLYNEFGANMVSGIVSTFLDNLKKTYNYCSLEVDEGSLVELTKQFKPDVVVVTNIFRDQLDRYGEVDITRNLIFRGIGDSLVLMNGDDPNLNLFQGEKKVFFSVESQTHFQNRNVTLDAQFCPVCGAKLVYEYYNVGHLGKFHCSSCGFRNLDPRFLIKNIKGNKNNFTFDFADKNANTIKNLETKEYWIYQPYNICAAFSCISLLGLEPSEV
jgi:UDP-N-acetylmuramyl tripeptide synthase